MQTGKRVGQAEARTSPWPGNGKVPLPMMFCGYRKKTKKHKGNIGGDVMARSEEGVQDEGVSVCLWKRLVTHIRRLACRPSTQPDQKHPFRPHHTPEPRLSLLQITSPCLGAFALALQMQRPPSSSQYGLLFPRLHILKISVPTALPQRGPAHSCPQSCLLLPGSQSPPACFPSTCSF